MAPCLCQEKNAKILHLIWKFKDIVWDLPSLTGVAGFYPLGPSQSSKIAQIKSNVHLPASFAQALLTLDIANGDDETQYDRRQDLQQ